LSLQTVFRAKGLGPGNDLWVVPEPDQSSDCRKIDWYLNFQITKALRFKPQPLPSEIAAVMTQNEWQDFYVPSKASRTIMIAADRFLPAKSVVLVPRGTSSMDWLNQTKSVWAALGRPSVRVFLPSDCDIDTAKSIWANQDPFEMITLVPA
jgi:hypothetical protein